ncbi:phage protein NinX family protein [Salmonella enterica]|uniref:phage protein NinX family protein n=1 Tax=Salmonella enterica TaxID=28901 RepID=UPI0013758692|nr:phage protein NinX family protein [Salmonella enterica]MDQ7510998.1 DUF2591 family protein [Salmonella enterica subsp. enterica serovar Agona]
MKVKTAELSGRALDWAVARLSRLPLFEMGLSGNWPGNHKVTEASLSGEILIRDLTGQLTLEKSLHSSPYSPSTDWSQCGPLIAAYGVWLSDKDGAFTASCKPHFDIAIYDAETPQIAICRAVVAARLGDEVDIPDELMEVGE